MTNDEAKALIARYRAEKGRTSAEFYMAYMWAREQVGEALTPAQRGFLAAARRGMSQAADE